MKKTVISLLICMSVEAYALQVSDSIYIGLSNNVANLVMSAEDYDSWIQNDGFQKTAQPAVITKKLYQYFEDDFDVIMLITNEKEKPQTISYYGINRPVANSVEGIGRGIYSNASYYGSEGKLFSLMYLPYMDAIMYGPTLHEFCHCWANYAIPTAVSGHWGICGGNTKGQLGGFVQSTLLTNVDDIANKYSVEPFGVNANGGNGVPYSEFELYLMGMLPIESVQEFDAFPDVPSETFQYCDDSKQRICFLADTRNHYTPSSLIDLLGQRVPDYTTSQKQFKALFVILSKEPLTSEEWTKCESSVGWFCRTSDDGTRLYNFWEATRGVGSIVPDDLSSSLKETTDIPTVEPDSRIDIHVMPSTIICSEPFRVFSLSGQDVTEQNGSLPYGVYVVHTAKGAHKVYVN